MEITRPSYTPERITGLQPNETFVFGSNPQGGLRKEDLYEISKPGKTTKACLSQWYPCKFTVNGIHYNSAEQFMMAEKARIMGDEETRKKILASTDPKEIKALGREVRNFDESIWQNYRYGNSYYRQSSQIHGQRGSERIFAQYRRQDIGGSQPLRYSLGNRHERR